MESGSYGHFKIPEDSCDWLFADGRFSGYLRLQDLAKHGSLARLVLR
jgi:hypothetical protein